MKFVALLFVSLFVIEISGNAEKKCGQVLAEVMWELCKGTFYTLPLSKRAGRPSYILPALAGEADYPYVSNSLSNIFELENENFAEQTRRTRMLGIADECCSNPCTYEQLKSYCTMVEPF